MLTVLKLLVGTALAFCILSPGSTPQAETCECKAKAAVTPLVPRADSCECKVKE
jgi:hypothetical protein